jgi:segregation and condensation protein B
MDELPNNHDSDADDESLASEIVHDSSWDEPLLADDLEQAYLRALEATDAIEREMDSMPHDGDVADESAGVGGTSRETVVVETPVAAKTAQRDQPQSVSTTNADQPADLAVHSVTPEPPRVSEKHVVEAALFVGGMPLTAKKLSGLFHTDHGFGFVECLIDELNQQYQKEGRPYSITLGEGGYRMTLLPDFDSVRNKVFGYGPKDVKLSQEVLEVLSLVAYKQPITRSQMETLGKANPGPLLRQLLQRELIRIDREHSVNESQRKSDPPYATTPRFLSLFGLGSLHDLPIAEDFNFK